MAEEPVAVRARDDLVFAGRGVRDAIGKLDLL